VQRQRGITKKNKRKKVTLSFLWAGKKEKALRTNGDPFNQKGGWVSIGRKEDSQGDGGLKKGYTQNASEETAHQL